MTYLSLEDSNIQMVGNVFFLIELVFAFSFFLQIFFDVSCEENEKVMRTNYDLCLQDIERILFVGKRANSVCNFYFWLSVFLLDCYQSVMSIVCLSQLSFVSAVK